MRARSASSRKKTLRFAMMSPVCGFVFYSMLNLLTREKRTLYRWFVAETKGDEHV